MSISEETKRYARKIGKLPKAPKKPKKSATLLTLKKYEERVSAYQKKINEMAKKGRELETIRKRVYGA